jgi:hypothetical protein
MIDHQTQTHLRTWVASHSRDPDHDYDLMMEYLHYDDADYWLAKGWPALHRAACDEA